MSPSLPPLRPVASHRILLAILDWLKGFESPSSHSKTDALHDELHRTIVEYGVTNRKLAADGKSLEDSRVSAPVDNSVHYFEQVVQVVGTPGNFHTEKSSAPQIITQAEFDNGVAVEVNRSHGKLGVYTHGIRTAAGEAGASAAELAADTGKPFVVEDWASTKALGLFWAAHQEKSDDEASYNSQKMINGNVESLVNRYGAGNIDMVAHSRGSMNQIRVLADLESKHAGAVHTATFAHSDVDVSDFEFSLPSFQKAAKHINVLYNPDDHALRLSEIQRFGQIALLGDNSKAIEQSARLGRIGLSPGESPSNYYVASKVPNYFSVSVDRNKDLIGHSFSPSLVASMIATPAKYSSFSTLRLPAQLEPEDAFSPVSGIGHVVSAVPEFALKVMSPGREQTDIVSDSPEVRRYLADNNSQSGMFGSQEPAAV